jgi:hypothetical protein
MRMFCVTSDQPQSAAYYKMFPQEPLASGEMVDITPQACPKITVPHLFDAIAKCSELEIGIASHGSGSGLVIPISAKSGFNLEDQALVCFSESFAKQTTDQDAAKRLNITTSDYKSLLDKIQRIKDKHLKRVIFRACIVGEDPNTLKTFRNLFGCTSVCAPTMLDLFGVAIPIFKTETSDWNEWKQQHPSATSSGEKPNRVSIDFEMGAGPTGNLFCQSDSKQALMKWIDAKMPKGHYTGGKLYLTCFVGGSKLIFPKDSDYKAHLQQSP